MQTGLLCGKAHFAVTQGSCNFKFALFSIGGPLFFHTARRVLEEASSQTPEVALVLCLRNTEVIDASGIQALKDVVNAHKEDEREIYLSGVSESQRDLLHRTGVIDMVGDALVFGSREAAFLAAEAAGEPLEDTKNQG